ncbi:hypothetical protein BDF14DRAFT_1966222 [Spinellus fusiger]|nr:hypothetical protein BDF14DRAFT_1966222 [Spinellus fusiger]
MMEREFQNMFTFSPGFEAASLKWHCKDQDEDSTGFSNGKKQMIGFARFRTRLEAVEAVEVLSGKKIDQDKGTALKAEMAKKNLHIKRGSVKMSLHHTLAYDSFSHLPSDLLSPADCKSDPFMTESVNPADQNPPCNTLYVGNLPANSNEEELRLVFAKCRGYKRMCFRNKPQGPMCFVEFEDVVFATQTLGELQGHTLSNSIKGGIRLSFSKNPLFTKPNGKDVSFGYKPMNTNLFGDRRDMFFDPQL